AEAVKQPTAPPAAVGALQPQVRDVKIEPPAPQPKPVAKVKAQSEKKESKESRREADKVAADANVSKDQASGLAGGAPSQVAAAPSASAPPPPFRQQVQATPVSPMAQQQLSQSAPSVSAEAVQELNKS